MYCKCGCGGVTKIATRTRQERGWIKGEHVSFIYGHILRDSNKPIGNIGNGITTKGYEYTTGGKLVHRDKIEKLLNKPLASKVFVHHWDENRSNNENSNLLVCQDNAYHRLIHQRMNAYKYSGNANWRKCYICKEYDDPLNMVNYKHLGNSFFHKECSRKKAKERYMEQKNVS